MPFTLLETVYVHFSKADIETYCMYNDDLFEIDILSR